MIRVGDIVMVNVPVMHDTRALVKFNGMLTKVTARRSYRYKTSDGDGSSIGATYQLEYCESRYGVPFTFMEDWLVGGGNEQSRYKAANEEC